MFHLFLMIYFAGYLGDDKTVFVCVSSGVQTAKWTGDCLLGEPLPFLQDRSVCQCWLPL